MTMHPKQALEILLNAASQAPLPKAHHVTCEQAYLLLKGLQEKAEADEKQETLFDRTAEPPYVQNSK